MADSSCLPLYRVLQSRGFDTHRYCKDLVLARLVFINSVEMEGPDTLVNTVGLVLDVGDERWTYHTRVYLTPSRPAGAECSQKPKRHPSMYTLLPVPLREHTVQRVGRLDQDIMESLSLTDDDQFVHTITNSRHQVPEVYEITTAKPVIEAQVTQLCADILLADENGNVTAAWAEHVGTHHLRMVLAQSKYHQVKRMVAAVGNHVAGLHHSVVGGLSLGDLTPDEWRWLETANLEALNTTPPHAAGPSVRSDTVHNPKKPCVEG